MDRFDLQNSEKQGQKIFIKLVVQLAATEIKDKQHCARVHNAKVPFQSGTKQREEICARYFVPQKAPGKLLLRCEHVFKKQSSSNSCCQLNFDTS